MGGEWRVRVEGKEAESRCGLRWTRVALAGTGGAGVGGGLVRISPQISASPTTGSPLRTSVQLPTMGSTSPPWELDKPKLSEERVDLALTWVGHLRAHLLIGFPLERIGLGEGEERGRGGYAFWHQLAFHSEDLSLFCSTKDSLQRRSL